MWYVQHAIFRAFRHALLNTKYTLFIPPKFESYILVGSESCLVPSNDLSYSRELQIQWSPLTKDMELKGFLGTSVLLRVLAI